MLEEQGGRRTCFPILLPIVPVKFPTACPETSDLTGNDYDRGEGLLCAKHQPGELSSAPRAAGRFRLDG